jgi:hypothetical protein
MNWLEFKRENRNEAQIAPLDLTLISPAQLNWLSILCPGNQRSDRWFWYQSSKCDRRGYFSRNDGISLSCWFFSAIVFVTPDFRQISKELHCNIIYLSRNFQTIKWLSTHRSRVLHIFGGQKWADNLNSRKNTFWKKIRYIHPKIYENTKMIQQARYLVDFQASLEEWMFVESSVMKSARIWLMSSAQSLKKPLITHFQ